MSELRLTAQQQKAVAMAAVAADEPGCLVRLSGCAGTGKSTTLREVVREVDSAIVLAPTGKAAQRAAQLTGRPAATIHRWLFFPQELANGRVVFVPKPDERLREDMPDGGLIVVDEASMLSREVFEALQRAAHIVEASILLVGDGFQLPPVGDGGGAIFTSVQVDDAVELTEVHRQALESPIIRVSQQLRHCRWSDVPRVLAGLPQTPENLSEELAKRHQAGEDVMAIVHSRKARASLNLAVRERLGRAGLPQAGEPVICRRNNYALGIFNGEIFDFGGFADDVVTRAGGATLRRTQVGQASCYVCPEVMLGHDLLQSDVELKPHELARSIPKGGEGDTPPSYLHAHLGYAITCHSAQGSEWDTVFVSVPPSLRVMPDQERLRWVYTAITRAKTQAFVQLGAPRRSSVYTPHEDEPRALAPPRPRLVLVAGEGRVPSAVYQAARAHIAVKAPIYRVVFDLDLERGQSLDGFEGLVAICHEAGEHVCRPPAGVLQLAQLFLATDRPVWWWHNTKLRSATHLADGALRHENA